MWISGLIKTVNNHPGILAFYYLPTRHTVPVIRWKSLGNFAEQRGGYLNKTDEPDTKNKMNYENK
jgi:hypothetical protein